MKRPLILIALVLTLVALPFEVTVRAEAPPTFIGAGALFQNGGSTEFALQASVNANILQKVSQPGDKTSSQIYGSARIFLADDAGLNTSITQQLEAIAGYVIGEITYGQLFIATGIGIMTEPQEGENPYAPAVLLEGGWKPISLMRLTVGGQYIPITGMADLVFVYGGVGIQF